MKYPLQYKKISIKLESNPTSKYRLYIFKTTGSGQQPWGDWIEIGTETNKRRLTLKASFWKPSVILCTKTGNIVWASNLELEIEGYSGNARIVTPKKVEKVKNVINKGICKACNGTGKELIDLSKFPPTSRTTNKYCLQYFMHQEKNFHLLNWWIQNSFSTLNSAVEHYNKIISMPQYSNMTFIIVDKDTNTVVYPKNIKE